MSGPGTLKKLAQRSTVEREAALEQCELCGVAIPTSHSHVLELATRDVKCTCRPCGLLFDRAEKMRLIPTDVYAADVDVRLEDLRLPVDMAFFFRTDGELKCFYPSPMGPTECLLPRRRGHSTRSCQRRPREETGTPEGVRTRGFGPC